MENNPPPTERNLAVSLKINNDAYDGHFKDFLDNENFFISVTQEGKDGTNPKGTTTHKFKSKSKLRDAKEVPGQNYRLLENIAELNLEGTASRQKSLKNISLVFFTGNDWKTIVNTKAQLSTTNAIQNGQYEIDGFIADKSTADSKVCTFVLNKITKIQGEILTFKFSLHKNPSKSEIFPIKNLQIDMSLNNKKIESVVSP